MKKYESTSTQIHFQKWLIKNGPTVYDFGRKRKWCAVPELAKEKQAFCDLKQDVLSNLRIYLVRDNLWYKTKSIQDILTNSELNLIPLTFKG